MLSSFVVIFITMMIVTLIFEYCVFPKINWFKEHGTLAKKNASKVVKIFDIIFFVIVYSLFITFYNNAKLMWDMNIITSGFIMVNVISALVIICLFWILFKSVQIEEKINISIGRWIMVFINILFILISINALYRFSLIK